ncbi:MAG: DUF4249 family protein [Prolixibacteraceae bacterium]|jgi:hypothetical protein|nr:DUF4249 family protein [Prolixibacteraceae bacterium]
MQKKVLVVLVIPLILFLISCEREFEFDTTGRGNPVVLNGILEAGSLPATVFLYHSQEMGDTSNISPIEGATMWLETAEDKYTFEYTDSGRYICNIAPQSGKTYRVKALVGGDTVWAETTIPSDTGLGCVTLDTLEIRPWCYYKMDINDEKEVDNKYWFWVYELNYKWDYRVDSLIDESDVEARLATMYSKTPYADRFLSYYDPNTLSGYTVNYDYFLRVPDDGFDGERVIVDVYHPNLSSGNNGMFFMAAFDKHYDKYMKSYLTYDDYLGRMDELTIYYQPSFVYSNVHNGTGIFGSMAVKDTIISDNPLFQNYQYD